MGFWASLITTVVGTGIKLATSAGGPDYPSPPKLAKIPIQKAKNFMEQYEAQRMQSSIDAWKQRFPLLYQGGAAEIASIRGQQMGYLPKQAQDAIRASGLEMPKEGDIYKLSRDIGLSPLTLAQRSSEAVTRQIALNPEWTNKISGGTLATMIANNYQNQNAFTQFLGANQTAQYVAGQAANANLTKTLLAGVSGAASIGMNPYAPWNAQGQSLAPTPTPVTSSGYMGSGGAYPGFGGFGTPTTPPGYASGPASAYGYEPNLFAPVPNNYVSTDQSYSPYGNYDFGAGLFASVPTDYVTY
jgi:hypothetical protein